MLMPGSRHHMDDLVPQPFSLEQFRLAVQQRTGRRLVLEPAPLGGAAWIETADTDMIIYDQAADIDQQLRAIGHEIAHLLLGHQALELPSPLVHLDPAAVAGTIAFHGYSQEDERQADDFALLLLSAAGNTGPTAAQRPAVQPDSDLRAQRHSSVPDHG
jgi:hypothetical protein